MSSSLIPGGTNLSRWDGFAIGFPMLIPDESHLTETNQFNSPPPPPQKKSPSKSNDSAKIWDHRNNWDIYEQSRFLCEKAIDPLCLL